MRFILEQIELDDILPLNWENIDGTPVHFIKNFNEFRTYIDQLSKEKNGYWLVYAYMSENKHFYKDDIYWDYVIDKLIDINVSIWILVSIGVNWPLKEKHYKKILDYLENKKDYSDKEIEDIKWIEREYPSKKLPKNFYKVLSRIICRYGNGEDYWDAISEWPEFYDCETGKRIK